MNLRIQILKASDKNEKRADPDYDEPKRGKTNRSVLFFSKSAVNFGTNVEVHGNIKTLRI